MAKEEKALAKQNADGAVVVPDAFKKYTGKGMEHVTSDDMQLPRLALAQGLSPQIDKSDPLYIEDLELGDAYNSVTGEILGVGPWSVSFIRADPPRYVEFIPREEGGGVKDPDVPADDPRTEFTIGEDGKRVKPIATKFYDFVAVMLDTRELIALSFKSAGIQTAKRLNTVILNRENKHGIPMIAGQYKMTAIMEKNAQGKWAGLRIEPDGVITDPEMVQFITTQFENVKQKNVIIDREGGDTSDKPTPDADDM